MMNGEYRRNGRVIVRRGLALSVGLWLALVVGALPQLALADFDTDAADTISWFYTAAFGRTPVPNSTLPDYGDIDGLRFWTNEYLGGEGAQPQYVGQVYAIADFFVASDEFQAIFPNALTNEAFVTALYENMLGRIPDAAGLAFWTAKLNEGDSRGTVLADFTNTQENRDSNPARKAAMGSFIGFIDQDPDHTITPAEAETWLAANQNLDAATVDATFVLAVIKAGNGSGTIASNPGIPTGIACGSACRANFRSGESVSLTPTANEDSQFAGWTPAPCTASFAMPANNLTCTATFNLKTDRIAQPTFSPLPGNFDGVPQPITITTSTAGATIRFAVNDASLLDCATSTRYDNSVQVLVDRSLTLHAIACVDGNPPVASEIETSAYTITNSAPFTLNDSGVSLCYRFGAAEFACSDSRVMSDFPGQDANYGRDAWARTDDPAQQPPQYALAKIGSGEAGFDFTRICANGIAEGENGCIINSDPNSPPDPNNPGDWACVKDNVTGLTWAIGGAANPNQRRTWQQAVNDAGNLRLCEFGDWRLPTVSELQSILHYGKLHSLTNHFPDVRSFLWTIEEFNREPTFRWQISAGDGMVSWTPGDSPLKAFFVRNDASYQSQRCPRAEHFDYETVAGAAIHRHTGLMWTRCKVGKEWESGGCVNLPGEREIYDVPDALQKVHDINEFNKNRGSIPGTPPRRWRDFSDWRLPNVKEFGSIMNRCLSYPAPTIDPIVFPNLVTSPFVEFSHFWTASPYHLFSDEGWAIFLNTGQIGKWARYNPRSLLLVRNVGENGNALNQALPPSPGSGSD